MSTPSPPTGPRSTSWRIVPRMLRDVGERDTSVELFGRRFPNPFLLAPIGVLELAHREADLAVARAARDTGTPMILSNQASRPMEQVARELGDTPRWSQLYWSKSDELVESLVGRAQRCGSEAIVVTLDTTMLGWRTRDLELAYLPFLRGKGIAQYTSDPVFTRLLSEPGPTPPPEQQPKPSLAALATLIALTRAYPGGFVPDPALGHRTRRGPALHRDLFPAHADLGAARVPARAHQPPDPAQGHPPSRRRNPGDRRGHGRDRRLQPRRPPGRRLDRHARGAARGDPARSLAASRC